MPNLTKFVPPDQDLLNISTFKTESLLQLFAHGVVLLSYTEEGHPAKQAMFWIF